MNTPMPTPIPEELRASFESQFDEYFFDEDIDGQGAFAPREKILSFIVSREETAYQKGLDDGRTDEAIRCHEHCEKAREEEKALLIESLGKVEPYYGNPKGKEMIYRMEALNSLLLSHPKLSEGKMEGV